MGYTGHTIKARYNALSSEAEPNEHRYLFLSDRPRRGHRARPRLNAAGIPLDGASDHGVSEALYLRDPDQNGLELYRDRPQEQWPRTPDGAIAMYSRPLDLQGLLNEKP